MTKPSAVDDDEMPAELDFSESIPNPNDHKARS